MIHIATYMPLGCTCIFTYQMLTFTRVYYYENQVEYFFFFIMKCICLNYTLRGREQLNSNYLFMTDPLILVIRLVTYIQCTPDNYDC